MLDDMKLRRNPLFSQKENDYPRYFMEIEMNGTLEGVQKLKLPIFWRPQGGPHTRIKEIYSAQVVSTLIERGNLDDLTQGVKETLLNLVQSGFASYLILLHAGETIPIYYRNGMLSARVMDGPQYRDTDVGKVFCGIRDYLMLSGTVKASNQMRLNRVSPQDLRVHPLEFTLYYRGDKEIFIPVFSSEGGKEEFATSCEGRDFNGRNDLLSLRRNIAGYLMENNRIESPYDLRVCDLSFSRWGRLRPDVPAENLCLSYFGGEETKERLQIFSNGEELIAARSLDRGFELYFGKNLEDLKDRVSRDLRVDGSMKASGSLVVESMEAKTLPTGWREKALKVLELVGKENDILRLPPEVQEQRLQDAFRIYPFFELFYVMDRYGFQSTMNIVNPKYRDKISTAGKGVSRSFKKYFSEVKETNRFYLSEAYLSAATDSFCITVSIPLKNSFGELEYVLAGDINLEDLGLI
jgi:hypothetical protein